MEPQGGCRPRDDQRIGLAIRAGQAGMSLFFPAEPENSEAGL